MKLHLILALIISLLMITSLNAEPDGLEQLNEQGNQYVRQGLWDDAINIYEKAIKINPENANVHYNLSLALFYKRLEILDKDRERKLYEFVTEKQETDSKNDIIENNSIEQTLLKRQIEELQVSIKLNDKNPMAQYFLGTHYYNVGQLLDAVTHLKRAIELKPDYSNSYGVLASVCDKFGQNNFAIDCYKTLLEVQPENNETHKNLALVYNRLGMTKESLNEYEYLKQRDPVLADELKNIIESEKSDVHIK